MLSKTEDKKILGVKVETIKNNAKYGLVAIGIMALLSFL